MKAATSYDIYLNQSTTYPNGGWMYFKINNDDYMQLSGSDNKVDNYKDTAISGNLESQRLTINKPSNDDDIPLQIINNNQNWFVASLESTISGDGCLMQWKTTGSSTYWWSGVWGTNTNEFNIWFNYQGLSRKSNGSAVLSGSLTQNSDASFKDNVEDVDLTDCTNMLENIDVKTYTRNDMEEGKKRLGFIAQDVRAYLPDKFDNMIGSNIITDEQGENSK